jgi:hypothetical protein
MSPPHDRSARRARLARLAAFACTIGLTVAPAGAKEAPAAPPAQRPPRRKPDYSAPADAPYTAEAVTVTTPAGHTLAGTLTLPRGAARGRRGPAATPTSPRACSPA